VPHFELVGKKRHHKKGRKPAGSAPLAFVRTRRKDDSEDAPSTKSDESDEIKISGWKKIFHPAGRLRSALHTRKGKSSLRSSILPKVLGIFSVAEQDVKKDDLERGKERDSVLLPERVPASTPDEQNVGNVESRRIDLIDAGKEKPLQLSKTETKEEDKSALKEVIEDKKTDSSAPLAISPVIASETKAATATRSDPQDKEASVDPSPVTADVDLSSTRALDDTQLEQNSETAEPSRQVEPGNQNMTSPPRADTFKEKDKLADIPEERPAATGMAAAPQEQPRRSNPRRPPIPRVPLGQLDEILIKAYSLPSDVGQVAPLQLRRTLDQYFYTHLASTYERDMDQVVLRYTQEGAGVEPKIFMVDQLWLWILNGGKFIFKFWNVAH